MKTKKAYKEAILRAHQNTEEENQAQENLLHYKEKQTKQDATDSQKPTELHESPSYLMRSWKNLRNLDQDLADQKGKNNEPK